MKKYKISIGITAYNEEKNIINVLRSLLSQSHRYYQLKELILILDGCTDKTEELTKKVKSNKLKIIVGNKRLGQPTRQNQIIKIFKGEVLVFVEADTLPENFHTLDSLMKKFSEKKGTVITVGGDKRKFRKSFLGKIQNAGYLFKKRAFKLWKGGRNIYWLGGHSIKAVSRDFAKKLNFPTDVPEDAYIYLTANKLEVQVIRLPNVNMITGTAQSFTDWILQSKKFITGKNSLGKYFGKEKIKSEYNIPLSTYVNSFFESIKKRPLWIFLYMLMLSVNRFYSAKKEPMNPKYEIYTSTKELSRPVKIIFSNYDDIQNPYYGGGGAISIHEVAKRLVETYQITVITGSYPGAKNKTKDGVYYKRIGPSFAGPYLGQIIYSLLLPLFVITQKYDIWLESFTPPFTAGFLPIFTKKPVVGVAHMLAASDMERKYKFPFSFVEKFGLKFYKHMVATSEIFAKKIAKLNPYAQIYSVPNGTNIPGTTSSKGTYLLYVGRIEQNQKGLDILLKSFKKIVDKINIPLVVAGRGTNQQVNKFKTEIERLGLTKKVKLLGSVKNKKLESAYEGARAVVISSRFETFSMVALEAMARKKPVVAFDIDGLKWIPKKMVFKIKPFDIDKLSKNLGKVTENPDIRMVRRAYDFAKKFSWDNVSQSYEKVILAILKKYEIA